MKGRNPIRRILSMTMAAVLLCSLIPTGAAAYAPEDGDAADGSAYTEPAQEEQGGAADAESGGSAGEEPEDPTDAEPEDPAGEEPDADEDAEEADDPAGGGEDGFTISMGGDVSTYADDMLTLELDEGQYFKIRGTTTFKLTYNGKPDSTEKTITITLPPFFKFVTIPKDGSGYTVESKATARGNYLGFFNGVPLPKKYYTAAYRTDEANAAELLAYDKFTNCDQITLSLDSGASSRRFEITFSIQIDDRQGSPDYAKYPYTISYIKLGELMVQAGTHYNAIPLNVCTSVSDTASGDILAEAVYNGTSKLTDETGTVELSGDFTRSFQEKAPEGLTPGTVPDAGKDTRPRVGNVTGALYTFEDYFYPYTDVEVYYPVSEGCLFIYNESVNSEGYPKYDTYDPAPLEYIESLQETYEIVEHDGKKYYKVYATEDDENCPNGYVRVYADRYRGARFAYVLPDRDSLVPGQTFEFGDILISYTHKGVRTEFETIGTINPYVCKKGYAPEFVERAYSDTKKDFDWNIMSRPQGQEDSYYFALDNTDNSGGTLYASYKKAHLAYSFPWEISPKSVEIYGETDHLSLIPGLYPSVNDGDPNNVKVTMLPETVSYYYFGDSTEHKIAVNGNRTVTFPKSNQHIETIVFNYDVLPAYSVPQFIVKADNMSVNQEGEALPDKYPCRFGISLTTDPNGGGRYYGTDPDNGTFEPTEDTPWILWKDNRGPDEPVYQYGVYLTQTLDTLMFGIRPSRDYGITLDDIQINCHDQNDFLLDSRNTSNSSPYALSFGLRKLDDNTKDYANVKITLEPKTEADAGAFSLISGLESTFFTIGEECDKLDIYLYTNLYPDGRKVDYTKYNPGAENNEVTSYQWKFDLADGEYPTKIVIDLGTIHTNAKRFPATRNSGLRDGQILGGKYSTSFAWGSVPYFNVRFKGSSTFFTGSEQETPVPTDTEYKITAKISTTTDAKFINGKGDEGVDAYDTVEGTVHFKSRFEAWLGYKNEEAEVKDFKENGKAVNYTAYQGSNVSFRLEVPNRYNSVNYSGEHFYTSADMKTTDGPLQRVFSQNNYYSFPGKVYFQVPKGIQFNSVKAVTLYQGMENPVELVLSQVKELANGDNLYIYEGDMCSIPGVFLIDATILPGAETGKYELVKDWGLSMDGFAQKYMQGEYQEQYPHYTYHFTESFPEEWGVDDQYVLKAAPTAQKVEVLSASIDGILIRPGKDAAESTLTVNKPFTHYYQLFGEGQKNSLLGSVTLFNGGTSALNEYQAEIELPRSGGKAVGYLSNGEAQEVTNDFSLYLSGGAAVKASDKIQGLTVTYLDDDRKVVDPKTAEDYAGVRYIQVSFRNFQPKDSVRLTLPLMTDYEKTDKAPEYAYLSASGQYKQDADSQWGDLKAVNPVAFRFDSARALVVRKEVTGSGADKTKAFEFHVTVTENGTSHSVLPYRGLGGLPDGVYVTGYDQYIALKDGQGVEFYDLQPDAQYTVYERSYSKDGYYTSYTRQTEETTEEKTGAYEVKGTLDYGTHTLTFTNYKGPVATWTLAGTKMVNGEAGGGENFSFYREPCDENGNSTGDFDYVNNYVNSAGDTGELRAKDITYTKEGDYWYKLYESSGSSYWILRYDPTVYLIQVHVFMDGQDMKAEPHYFVLGEDGSKTEAESIVFHNIKAEAAKVSYHWVGETKPDDKDIEVPKNSSEPIGRPFMAAQQIRPEGENIVFAGWYTDEACTKPFANGSILQGNLDLYGYWTKVEVGEDEILVSYMWDLWDGDGTPTDVAPPTYDIIRKGSDYTPKEQEPSSQGFTFHGWYDWDYWDDFTGGVLNENLILCGYWTKDDVGSLTVSKTVTGSGSTTKAFTFTVTLTDESGEALPDTFSYTGNGVPDGTVVSGGTVSLAHGQSVTITGLPAGTSYSVTENEANQGGYTTTGTNTAGTIQTGTAATAAFVNHMPSSSSDSDSGTSHTSLTVKKQWAGDANRAQPASVSVQLYRDGSAYGKPVELSAENRWSYTWTGLSTNSRWTVDEVDVPAGYTKTVSHSGTQWLITNTYDFMLNTKDHYAYVIGYRDGTVRPRANITRAEVATVFFRMLTDTAREKYWSTQNSFSDVSADDWCNNAISTMEQAGIISGYADGTFRPYDPITRAELVKIAVGFFKLTGHPAIESKFTDIQGHWAENYILFAAELGLVDGYLDGTFAPDKLVTRCEAMKIINHALGRAPEKDHLLSGMTQWPDNADTSAWFYAEVQEATNSHACDWISGDSAMENWTKILPVRDWAAFETAWAANSGSVPDVPNPGEVVD